MAVGIKSIAKETGFSEATVSLALNNSSLVNNNTKKKILEAAEKVGYVPNSAARNLARKKSGCIGLIVPDIENVFYASLIKYINYHIKLKGYNLIIAVSDNNCKVEKRIIENMIENRAEGVIIVPMNVPNKNPEYIKRLNNYSIPYIFCSDYYNSLKQDASIVMSDFENGMYFLAKDVIKRGYKNIVYLTGDDAVPSLKLRLDGFNRASYEENIKTKIFRLKRVDYKNACGAVAEILKTQPETDAFICVNDMIAIGVVNTLTSMGFSLPDEKGVAGFDNIIFSKIAYPGISTVEQDIEKIALSGIEELLKQGEKKEKILIPTQIIMRESLKK